MKLLAAAPVAVELAAAATEEDADVAAPIFMDDERKKLALACFFYEGP